MVVVMKERIVCLCLCLWFRVIFLDIFGYHELDHGDFSSSEFRSRDT